ncbi:hypothetical protein E2C01_101291 [Portunus trituberculatus]|uniref:Uncharacterized protein n=1 Tax=Portunus trituberculatus TaxID=210409 RepID=A0A5B7K5B8_PORTR|nr:hypothetical protein [Portunus trituberculatus]
MSRLTVRIHSRALRYGHLYPPSLLLRLRITSLFSDGAVWLSLPLRLTYPAPGRTAWPSTSCSVSPRPNALAVAVHARSDRLERYVY